MGVHRYNFGLAVVCGLPVVSAIFVGLRILARRRRRIRLGWDDWVVVLATLLSFGLIAPSVIEFRLFHWGYHVWEFPLKTSDITGFDYDLYYAGQLGFNLLSIPILPLCKASIILLLLRVGKVLDPICYFLYAVFVFNALAAIIPWALLIFICPSSVANTSSTTTFGGLECMDLNAQGKLLLFVNCANLFTDVLVFPVPFFIMRELMNTTWRSKLTILATFATSLCVTVLSALKVRLTEQDRIIFNNTCGSVLPCRTATPDWMWSLDYCITHGEANIGIIVACVPVLRGLISPRALDSVSIDITYPYSQDRSAVSDIEAAEREARQAMGDNAGQETKETEESLSSTSGLIIQGTSETGDYRSFFNATAPLPPPDPMD